VLILSRKPGQSIIIGGIIEITVAEVRGDQVRIGITAPRSVPVFRTEVIVNQNRLNAAGPEPENLLELLSAVPEDLPPSPSRPTQSEPAVVPAPGGVGE
jgi:carbon storage regulator